MSVKKIMFGFAAMAFLLFLEAGCYYDKTVLIEDEVEVPDDISFSRAIIPLFNASCSISGCHNTGGTPPVLAADKAYNNLIGGNYINLTTPEDSELYQWLTGKRNLPMPLSGPNAQLNAAVLAWIKKGAPNN